MKFNDRSIYIPLLSIFILVVIGLAVLQPKITTTTRPDSSKITPNPTAVTADIPAFSTTLPDKGLTRLAQLHTDRPHRPRFEVMKYTIQKGDTAWSLAQKFDLKIESILWGNEGMSADAGMMQIGKEINILPVDGVLHTVKKGDTLELLEIVHGAPVKAILDFIGNNFDGEPPAELREGQQIIVPGGKNPVVWQEPGPQVDPQKGRKSGGFFDGALVAVGTGTFIWPASPVIITQPFWSGHPAIDIDTYTGQPVFASDGGTVIFSGLSERGYGNLVIIDHGNGFWTYYAHNEVNLVSEGQGVYQGQQIAEFWQHR